MWAFHPVSGASITFDTSDHAVRGDGPTRTAIGDGPLVDDISSRDCRHGCTASSNSALSRQTGLSRRYCKLIITGECVPHPVHWDKFPPAP